jgi:hypothetical protein
VCHGYTAENLNIQSLEQVVQDFNEHAQQDYRHVHSDCKKQLYLSYDKQDIAVENESIFSLYKMGLFAGNISLFAKHRFYKKLQYAFPGTLLLSNGPINNLKSIIFTDHCSKYASLLDNIKAIKNSFNYEREALANLVLLKHFYNKGLPIQVLSTICYGWQGIVYTLHALMSNDQIAQNMRKVVDIDWYLAEELLSNIKLIRVQAPMVKAVDSIESAAKTSATYFTRACLASGLCAAAYSRAEVVPLGLAMIYRINEVRINAFVNSIFSYCGYNYVMPSISYMNEYSKDGLQLLYDLQKSRKKFKNITLFMSWQSCDPYVKPLSVSDMQLYGDMFNFYGMGSFGDNHEDEHIMQKIYSNTVRKLVGACYFSSTRLQERGEKIFNALEPYRMACDWEGLKLYTENLDPVITKDLWLRSDDE